MIDPDLQKQLVEINTHLAQIKKNSKLGVWRAFFNGMFGALGYIAGIAIVTIVLGWILNKAGYLEPFQKQFTNFMGLMQSAQRLIGPTGDNQNTTTTSNSRNGGGDTIVTLPDGRQVRVQIPQQ